MKLQSSFVTPFVFVAVAVVTTACSQVSSNSVDPSTLYGSMTVDREGSAVSVSNTFYVGGSTGTVVTMDSPASVVINGSAAAASDDPIINMTSYIANFSSSTSTIDVIYMDKNGKSYHNSVSTPGDLWLSSVPATASESSGFSMTANTHNPFFSGEQFTITLTDTNGAAWSQLAYANSGSTSQTLTVSNSNFGGQTLSPGAANFTVCRASYPGAQEAYPEGLTITVKSCASGSLTLTN